MGKNSGTFIFEYYTDTKPDVINIYSGQKVISDKLLSSINEATGHDGDEIWNEKRIQFSNSNYITIEVNTNTIWKYRVNCPN